MAAPPAQRDLWLFLGLTFVLGWSLLAILPLVGAEPGSRTVSVVLALNAFCPGIAAWVVERMAFRRSALAARTGLLVRVPGISWGRWWALAWIGTPLLLFAALAISASQGTVQLDFADFSTLRATVLASPGGEQMLAEVDPQTMFFTNLASAVLVGPLISALPVFGIEWGFRGWLLPRLWSTQKPWVAILGHALIFAVWLLPLVLLGQRYEGAPLAGSVLLVVHTVLLSLVLGWLRLSSGSIWPAVIVMASIYGLTPVLGLLPTLGVPVDPVLVGFQGAPGVALLATIVTVLALFGRLPRPPPPAPLPTADWSSPPPPVSTPAS